jgi:photosystem II stability/assembly factor-like uncharacterized protein
VAVSQVIRASSATFFLLVLQGAVAIGAPILRGEVPVEYPTDVLFHRGVFWMRQTGGSLLLSMDQGGSWSRPKLPAAGAFAFFSMMRPDLSTGGVALATYESSVLVVPPAKEVVHCTAMASSVTAGVTAGTKPKGTRFARGFTVAPNGQDRVGIVGWETEEDTVTSLYRSRGCRQEWSPVKSFPAGVDLSFLVWPREQTLLAGNACRLFLSRDAGDSWIEVNFSSPLCKPDVDTEPVSSIQFLSESHGVLSLQLGRIYVTVNGGLTWSLQNDELSASGPNNFTSPTARDAGAVCFQNESVGWRVRGDSELQMTTDGGKVWQNWGGLGPITRIVGPDKAECYVIANKRLYQLAR